jgi:hypothetical protein
VNDDGRTGREIKGEVQFVEVVLVQTANFFLPRLPLVQRCSGYLDLEPLITDDLVGTRTRTRPVVIIRNTAGYIQTYTVHGYVNSSVPNIVLRV